MNKMIDDAHDLSLSLIKHQRTEVMTRLMFNRNRSDKHEE